MLTDVRAVAAPRRMPPPVELEPPEPWAALLESLGPVEDEEHVVVLGRDGPDLMCALSRAGARSVTHLRSHERLEAASTSLIILPHVGSLDTLADAVPALRRALCLNGRLAICIDTLPASVARVRRALASAGFVTIHACRAAGRTVLSAEVPAFHLRRCA